MTRLRMGPGLVPRVRRSDHVRLIPSPSPDFLWNLVALANFMRLSLLKGARAASSSAARQEILVPGWAAFGGRPSGPRIHRDFAVFISFSTCHRRAFAPDQERRVECCGIPLKPKRGLTPISCHAALERSACAPFIKERRMECINATSLRRKSGQWGTQLFSLVERTAGPSATLPRISCGVCWRWRTLCGFPY
jgi:hypothetical protein